MEQTQTLSGLSTTFASSQCYKALSVPTVLAQWVSTGSSSGLSGTLTVTSPVTVTAMAFEPSSQAPFVNSMNRLGFLISSAEQNSQWDSVSSLESAMLSLDAAFTGNAGAFPPGNSDNPTTPLLTPAPTPPLSPGPNDTDSSSPKAAGLNSTAGRPGHSAGLSRGETIGLGVAVPLAVLILSLGAYVLYLKARARRRKSEQKTLGSSVPELEVRAAQKELSAESRVEAEADLRWPELDSALVSELPGQMASIRPAWQ